MGGEGVADVEAKGLSCPLGWFVGVVAAAEAVVWVPLAVGGVKDGSGEVVGLLVELVGGRVTAEVVGGPSGWLGR